jgi:DNA (cytosine-5)-methyltransferase 1
MLSVGSLFSGIGGFDLGLERAGMRCLWQCEIDPYCQRVLARHWPDVLRVRDVRELRAGDVPAVDVLCGGFPCQDLSRAGLRAGIDGSRSGLWSEYARLIGELRPRYVAVENVTDLLAGGIGRVLGDLATLGYDAEWDCIPASILGAPHRRDRLWLIAYPNGEGSQGPRSQHELSRLPPAVPSIERRDWWTIEPEPPRVDDGVPGWMDRVRATGNALVPQIAEWIGRRIVTYERRPSLRDGVR